jgi:hypothetical protein
MKWRDSDSKPLSRFPRERRGPPAKRVGGEGLYSGVAKTLTPQAFGLGPPSPAESGRGELYSQPAPRIHSTHRKMVDKSFTVLASDSS